MRINQKEKENLLRWDGSQRGFYEVYFIKWNDADSKTAGWIRYTLTSPVADLGQAYAELWGIFFDQTNPDKNIAVKQRLSREQLHWDRNRLDLKIADSRLLQNRCHGTIVDAGRGHSMAWELEFVSDCPVFYHYPFARLYQLRFPKTKVLSPHLDAKFFGTITADGRKIKLQGAKGQQTHIWGAKHALRWAWGHCNQFCEDPDAVFEGLDAQVQLTPLWGPHFKIFYLRTRGREYYFNSPLHWFLSRSRWKLGQWNFEIRNQQILVKGEILSRPAQMVGVTYTDPDGELLWCNNSKLSSIRLSLLDASGCRMGELSSAHACAAEYVDRRIYPEVSIRI